jgi:hypothetical protein
MAGEDRFLNRVIKMCEQGDSHLGMFTYLTYLAIVLRCTMMSLYIMLELFQSHIHVI